MIATGPAMAGACPYLGLEGDPRTRFAFSSPAHRCYAGARPVTVSQEWQAGTCLVTASPRCDSFARAGLAGAGAPRHGPAAPDGGAHGNKGTGGTKARPPWRTSITVPTLIASPAIVGAAAVLIGAAAILASIAAFGVVSDGQPGLDPNGGAVVPLTQPSMAASEAPSMAPSTLPTPAPTAAPTVARIGSSLPGGSASPTIAPAATPIVHTVTSGENLGTIAARYKVTVTAIIEANHLTHPDLIMAGDRLVIPRAP